jgi:hypothetical protein
MAGKEVFGNALMNQVGWEGATWGWGEPFSDSAYNDDGYARRPP